MLRISKMEEMLGKRWDEKGFRRVGPVWMYQNMSISCPTNFEMQETTCLGIFPLI